MSFSTLSGESLRSKILGVWPAPVTAELSVLFMQKIVSISISNIAYARRLCRADSFIEREVHGIHMKILRDDMCENGYQIIKWLKGAFDALHKKYLRMMIFAVHTGSVNSPALESYSYEFKYFNNSEQLQCVIRSTGLSSEETSSKYTVKKNTYCPEEIEKMTKKLMESCQRLGQVLKPLPEEKILTMKLLYYDQVTPQDYEPPGFVAANTSTVTYACEGTPAKYRLGYVATEFHATKVYVNSTFTKDREDTALSGKDINRQWEALTDISEDVIPATPERQRTPLVMTPLQTNITASTTFSHDDNHKTVFQTATEQQLPEHHPACVVHLQDSHQFAVPQPYVKRSRASITSNNENQSSIDANIVGAPTKAKKKRLLSITERDEKVEPLKQKKNMKKSTKKLVKKKTKVKRTRVAEKNKENVSDLVSPVADDTNIGAAQATDLADIDKSTAVTSLTSTVNQVHESEIRGTSFSGDSEAGDKVAVSKPAPVMKQMSKRARPVKSSVSVTTIDILETSASSSMLAMEKDVNCCCNSFQEFGLMIRCEVCMTWQHSICYGIMDGNSEFIEHHCCVQCAEADPSRQCTDRNLFRHNEESRTAMCIFRRALHLCHQQSTVTKVLLQKEMEVTDDTAERLVSQLKDKDIIRGSGPRSTVFTVNLEKLTEWLTRVFRRR